MGVQTDLVMDHLVLMGVNPWVPAFLEAGLLQHACLSPPALATCFFLNADSPSQTQAFRIQQVIIVK